MFSDSFARGVVLAFIGAAGSIGLGAYSLVCYRRSRRWIQPMSLTANPEMRYRLLDGGAHSTGFGGEPQADNKSVDASALSSRKTIRRSSH